MTFSSFTTLVIIILILTIVYDIGYRIEYSPLKYLFSVCVFSFTILFSSFYDYYVFDGFCVSKFDSLSHFSFYFTNYEYLLNSFLGFSPTYLFWRFLIHFKYLIYEIISKYSPVFQTYSGIQFSKLLDRHFHLCSVLLIKTEQV